MFFKRIIFLVLIAFVPVSAQNRTFHIPKPVIVVKKTVNDQILPESRGVLKKNISYGRMFLEFEKSPDLGQLETLGLTGFIGESNRFSAYIPLDLISTLNKVIPDLKNIDVEIPPHPLSFPKGEEVSLYHTQLYTSLGYDGKNVKVAVIDGGFYGYQDAVSVGRLPSNVQTINFSTSPFDANEDSGSIHGTAVAEIIYEIAPNVELYLIKISDSGGMIKAKNFCISQKIDIVNHSMGWFVNGWGRGDGYMYKEIVYPLFKEGVLWVNSAGNEAQHTYYSDYVDNAGYHDFSGNSFGVISNVNPGETIALYMNWDAYDAFDSGLSFTDYDLELYDSTGTLITVSSNRQPGYRPVEIIYTNGYSGDLKYKIKKRSGSGIEKIRVVSFHNLGPRTSHHSIMSPADGEWALCVGAVAYSDWTTNTVPRSYSSRGPAMDDRIKPDVVGIDGMTNYIYKRFTGTSASAPSVAGLAALILSKEPYLTPDQIINRFRDNAIDVGVVGPDNDLGYGKVGLQLFPLRRNPIASSSIIVTSLVKSDRKVYYYGAKEGSQIILRSLSGEALAKYEVRSGVFPTGMNHITLDNPSLVKGMYILEFEGTDNAPDFKKIFITD